MWYVIAAAAGFLAGWVACALIGANRVEKARMEEAEKWWNECRRRVASQRMVDLDGLLRCINSEVMGKIPKQDADQENDGEPR
jgi:hypothetical protein